MVKRALSMLLLLAITACNQEGPVSPTDEAKSISLARRSGPPPGPPPGPPAGPPPTAVPATELQLTITGYPDHPVNPGDTFGFDIRVANIGSSDALRVTLDGALPNVQSPWSVAWTGGTSVTCVGLFCGVFRNIGGQTDLVGPDLAPGEFYSVRASTANTGGFCGTAILTATVVAENAPLVQTSASVTVTCPPQPVLEVTVAGGPPDNPVFPGDALYYDITVRNTGSATATWAFLSVVPPDNVSQWSLQWTAGIEVNCSFGLFCFDHFEPGDPDFVVGPDLAPGEFYTARLATSSYGGACGSATASATATSPNAGTVTRTGFVTVICDPL